MKYEFGIRKVKRIFLICSAVLFLAFGCNRTIENKQVGQPADRQANQVNNQPSNTEVIPPANGEQKAQLANQQNKIQVSHKIEGETQAKILSWSEGETKNALEILKSNYSIETKTFSGIGDYVVSIDGVKEDSKHFWALYVNGKQSQVGASDYKLKDGDKVEWKFEEIK